MSNRNAETVLKKLQNFINVPSENVVALSNWLVGYSANLFCVSSNTFRAILRQFFVISSSG